MKENTYKHLRDIFKESVVDGIKEFFASFKKIRTYLFGSIGAFYSTKEKLFDDVQNSFTNYLKDSPYIKAGLFFIAVLILLFIFYQIKQFLIQAWRKWILIKRESVYGNAIVLLSNAYAKIHKNKSKELTLEQAKAILQGFCDSIREIYEFKTKAKCSVSIKTIIDLQNGENGINFDTRVVNLCRDSNCKKRYDSDYESIEHKIANNTCYQRIISKFFSNKPNEMYFLSNDLLSLKDYENSSFLLYPEYSMEIREDDTKRKENWPLKYKSELVVSLTPLEREIEENYPILGFLCVDCELDNKEVFNSHYDVPLLLGVSDGLYEFIKLNLFKTHEV